MLPLSHLRRRRVMDPAVERALDEEYVSTRATVGVLVVMLVVMHFVLGGS